MTVAEKVVQKLKQMPDERQRAVLAFVEQLEQAEARKTPRIDPEGLLAHIKIDLRFEDFAQNRREMWGTATDGEI